jgi:hypothetical protein
MDANIIEGHDVGVAERACEFGLPLKAFEKCSVPAERLGDDLDGHVATEPSVPGSVNLGHATGSEKRHYLIGAQPSTRGKPHNATLHRASK